MGDTTPGGHTVAAVLEGSSEELQSGGTWQAAPHAGSELTLQPLALA